MDFSQLAAGTLYFTLALVFIVEGFLLVNLWRHQGRGTGKGAGSFLIQVIWTVVPALVLAALLLVQGSSPASSIHTGTGRVQEIQSNP